ncbi:MAG: alpha/beta fold hydrolase [Balneolaceae bacterium]
MKQADPLFIQLHQQREGLPWLLILHGFMGAGELFGPIAGRLTEFCNPVTVDLPGHGRSIGSKTPEVYHAERQVERLTDVIDHLEQLEKVICHQDHLDSSHLTDGSPNRLLVYGYSMGGRLALHLAAAMPERVSGLLLESTTPGLRQVQQRRERQALDEERAVAIERDFPGFLKQWKAMPLFAASRSAGRNELAEDVNESQKQIQDQIQKRYPEVMRRQKPGWLAASLRGFGTGQMPHLWNRLSGLNMPSLLLSGSRDNKFCIIHEEMSRQLPNAVRKTAEGAGHRVHADRPEWLIQKIRTFIQSTGI